MPTKPKQRKRLYLPEKSGGYVRIQSRQEYHTGRWTRESRAFRESNPLCAACFEEGIITPTEVVDHIIPAPICDDFWDMSNWQPLCRKCNTAKGNRDKRLINEHMKNGRRK
jgi:5-methylcytosine-specific restriction protein A